jgi:hypothetical protein
MVVKVPNVEIAKAVIAHEAVECFFGERITYLNSCHAREGLFGASLASYGHGLNKTNPHSVAANCLFGDEGALRTIPQS